jgi:hypothetical protein
VLQHLAEEIGQAQIATLVVHIRGHVADHMAKNVETDEVYRAEGRGAGPAHGLSGERVDVFDA